MKMMTICINYADVCWVCWYGCMYVCLFMICKMYQTHTLKKYSLLYANYTSIKFFLKKKKKKDQRG